MPTRAMIMKIFIVLLRFNCGFGDLARSVAGRVCEEFTLQLGRNLDHLVEEKSPPLN